MEDAELLTDLGQVLFGLGHESRYLVLFGSHFVSVICGPVPEHLCRFAFVQELTPVLELVRTEESVLAVEGLPVEDPAVVADVLIVLVEHVARANPIYAFLAFLDRQCLVQILIEDEHLVVLCHLLEAITVQLGGFGEVAGFDWLVFKTVEH